MYRSLDMHNPLETREIVEPDRKLMHGPSSCQNFVNGKGFPIGTGHRAE
jgi:hypothetical protein